MQMSEEITNSNLTRRTPGGLRAAAGLAPQPNQLGEASIAEDHPADVVKRPPANALAQGWYSGKAVKIKIFAAEGEGEECVFKLGDSPFLRVRRGVEVIVPLEIISLLDDTVVDIPRTKWVNGKPIGEYIERVTRFPYTNLGEVPWSHYTTFRDQEKRKPMSTQEFGSMG
jgi:hypothetical protein